MKCNSGLKWVNPFIHNVVEWPKILLKSCGVNTASNAERKYSQFPIDFLAVHLVTHFWSNFWSFRNKLFQRFTGAETD